jgi:hypothetical protein
MNFGWPCREGLHETDYVTSAPPAHSGCSSLGTPNNPATTFTPPVSDWHHDNGSLSSPGGVTGNAATGSVFYEGTRYPAAYQGSYFFADFGQSWIRRATVDANDNVITFSLFGDDVDNPVDLLSDPISKDIYYVSISTGQVRRIRYFGSPNGTPVAMASAAPLSGGIPLTVTFSSAGSSDPNGDPLEYIWDFGDGSGAFGPNPTHVYTTTGAFAPTLTVSDLHGGYNTKALQVTVGTAGAFPGTSVVDDFNRPSGSLTAPWVNTSLAAIANNQLRESSNGYSSPIWTGTLFGPDQEAYYTFAISPAGPEFHLDLKWQSGSPWVSHIEVKYAGGGVQIATFDDTGVGWVMRGPPIAVTFNSGDQFGARVYGSTVDVFKNGNRIGTRSIAGWAFVNSPGYIGLAMQNVTSRLDNFGGGNFVPQVNTPPIAIISSPSDNSFYIEGQPIDLAGNASDGDDRGADGLSLGRHAPSQQPHASRAAGLRQPQRDLRPPESRGRYGVVAGSGARRHRWWRPQGHHGGDDVAGGGSRSFAGHGHTRSRPPHRRQPVQLQAPELRADAVAALALGPAGGGHASGRRRHARRAPRQPCHLGGGGRLPGAWVHSTGWWRTRSGGERAERRPPTPGCAS